MAVWLLPWRLLALGLRAMGLLPMHCPAWPEPWRPWPALPANAAAAAHVLIYGILVVARNPTLVLSAAHCYNKKNLKSRRNCRESCAGELSHFQECSCL